MDLQIRFYDNTMGEVSIRYRVSCLNYRPNAVNLCNEMTNATKNLAPANC